VNAGSVSASGAVSGATVLATGLTSGNCVQASTGGLLTTTGAACAAGGGVTSVTSANALLVAAPTTGAVVLTPNEAPTFTGSVTGQNYLNILNSGGGYTNGGGPGAAEIIANCTGGTPCNQQQAFLWATTAGSGINSFLGSDSTKTIQGVTGTYFDMGSNNNGTPTVTTAINLSTGAIGTIGSIASGTLTSGDCLQAGTNGVIQNAAAACGTGTVTAVTGSGVIVSSGGTTPNITCPTCGTGSGTVTSVTGTANQITSTNPTTTPVLSIPSTFIAPGSIASTTSITDGGLSGSSGDCVQLGAAGILTATAGACGVAGSGVTSVTSANALLVAAPTTGAVVLTPNETPTFTGTVTSANLTTGTVSAGFITSSGTIQTTGGADILAGGGGYVAGNNLYALALTSGQCVQSGTGGILTSSGAACGSVTSVTASGGAASSGGTTPNITVTNPVTATAPTVQRFTSGTGTYTTPAGVKWIKLYTVGGGGGGGGSGTTPGTGGTGGTTTFGTALITDTGGVGGSNSGTQPAGGTATVAAGPLIEVAVSGGQGGMSPSGAGGMGGNSCVGGAGTTSGNGSSVAGGSAATNSGSGGGGTTGGSSSSNGGAAGGCAQVIIDAPLATYAYAVGAAGTAGTAGTGGQTGGAGGSGNISVEEHYNY
jgi:hypothetical protein